MMTGGMGDRTQREMERLEAVSRVYDPSNPAEEFDYFTKRLHVQVMGSWLIGRHVLELGCATGELTSLLCPLALEYDVVEGSAHNIEVARQRVPHVRFHHSLWEEFDPSGKYSDVLLVCSLEHVEDPVGVLERARGWLADDGRLHVVVPNADSLHRYVGVEMGILESRTALSESDLRIGHRRVYDVEALIADLHRAGLSVMHWEGIFLKVLSNRQMLGWDWSLIEALHRVGRHFPGHCAELYAVSRSA